MLETVKYDDRYIDFIINFNVKRDYFLCHDLLEEIWKEHNRQMAVLKYLLQVAVMQYKKRKRNLVGYQYFYDNLLVRYELFEVDINALGIDATSLLMNIKKTKESNDELYEFDLKLTDSTLINLVNQKQNERR